MSTSGLVEAGLERLLDDLARRVAELIATERQSAPESPGWLNAKSAADYLDWTEDALRAAVKRGQVPCRRTPQRRLLFRRDELDAYVTGQQKGQE
jgi:hypothetical protein